MNRWQGSYRAVVLLGWVTAVVCVVPVARSAMAKEPTCPNSLGYPLVVNMPVEELAALKNVAHHGTVVVGYSDCRVHVLPKCTAPGSYRYRSLPITEERIAITNRDALYRDLPASAANLERSLKIAGKLDVELTTVGQYSSDTSIVYKEYIEGECRKATHYVTEVSFGAFKVSAGAVSEGDTGADSKAIVSGGNYAQCLLARPSDGEPALDCNTPIRVALEELTEGFPSYHVTGSHTHDGFFMRVEGGGGYLTGSSSNAEWEASDGGWYTDADMKLRSVTGSASFFLGFTPWSGTAVGAAAHYVGAIRPTLEVEERKSTDNNSANLALFGLFLQYYPAIHGGFNLGIIAGPCVALSNVEALSSGDCIGLSASVGYDWWISKEWSLGTAGRFTAAWASHSTSDGTGDYNLLAPTLQVAMTYH